MLALPRGLGLAAGWVLLLGTMGLMDGHAAAMAALALLLASRQISSGNVFRTAPFTFILSAAIVIPFTTVWALQGDAGVLEFAQAGALSWPGVRAGELWRIPATVFLHANWDHLRSNVAWILGLGLLLEPALGTRKFVQACVFTLVTSSAATLIFQRGGYGASGVLYGMEGVMLARPFRTRHDGRRVVDAAWALLAFTFILDIPFSQFHPTVGVSAHLGGFAGGLWFGCVWAGDGQSAPAQPGASRRWIAATALVLILLSTLALNPRWELDWHARNAWLAEQSGDLKAAARQWYVVESLADPGEPLDARKLARAAQFWSSHGNAIHARQVMSATCPTLGAEDYNDLGSMQAFVEPPDERAALQSWEQSLTLNPRSAEVLDRMAHVHLFPSDSTLYSPTAAVYLARCAVEQDRFETPDYIHTLALAEDRDGHRPEAIRLMKRALALAPEDSTEYLADLAEMQGKAVGAGDPDVSLR